MANYAEYEERMNEGGLMKIHPKLLSIRRGDETIRSQRKNPNIKISGKLLYDESGRLIL